MRESHSANTLGPANLLPRTLSREVPRPWAAEKGLAALPEGQVQPCSKEAIVQISRGAQAGCAPSGIRPLRAAVGPQVRDGMVWG